jgi:hypothetical protein
MSDTRSQTKKPPLPSARTTRNNATRRVVGVIHRNKAARHRTRTAGLDDAPVEAWRQAMLPHLHELAETTGFDGISESAFVFLCLLRLKPFERIGDFKDWVHRVTGYPRYEIQEFVDRAIKGFLMVDGLPNAEAFREAETDDEIGYVTQGLMVQVLRGKLYRDAAGKYFLPEKTT